MKIMSKYKQTKIPHARIEPRTSEVPDGPFNPLNRWAIVITIQNCRV